LGRAVALPITTNQILAFAFGDGFGGSFRARHLFDFEIVVGSSGTDDGCSRSKYKFLTGNRTKEDTIRSLFV